MAENEFGIGVPIETPESVKITKEPGPVQKLDISDTTKSSVNLAWEKPSFDGGSRISGYQIEITPKGKDDWKIVGEVKTTTYKVV